jgi:hypothetical protein
LRELQQLREENDETHRSRPSRIVGFPPLLSPDRAQTRELYYDTLGWICSWSHTRQTT